jgi:hypothetical protein
MARISDNDIVIALLSERTYKAASIKCGINVSHLRRKLADPKFQERLNREKQEVFNSSKTRLVSAANTAVELLHAILDDPMIAKLDKMPAIRLVMELSQNIQRDDLYDARLKQIEDRQQHPWEDAQVVLDASALRQLEAGDSHA